MLSLKKSMKEEKKVKQLLNIWQYLNIQILRFLETKRKIKQRQKKIYYYQEEPNLIK